MGTFFLETQPSGRRYVYLGRYVFEKLPRRGGGTLIWGGSFIWQWIVKIHDIPGVINCSDGTFLS